MNERPDIERIKSELAERVVRLLGELSLTDGAVRERFGIAEVEMTRIRHAEAREVSIDRLIAILNDLDQQVTVCIVPAPKVTADTRPIWEKIAEITARVPPEEWEKLPTDLAANHDHYLYGSPKRD